MVTLRAGEVCRLPFCQCGCRTRRRPVGSKNCRRLQGKPPPLVSQFADAARRRVRGCTGDAACAARRRFDRAGSRPQRSGDGARGKGSGDGAAEECGGEDGWGCGCTRAEEAPALKTYLSSSLRKQGPIPRVPSWAAAYGSRLYGRDDGDVCMPSLAKRRQLPRGL